MGQLMRFIFSRPGLGTMIYLASCCVLGSIFAFAAVQGDYGVLRRMQIESERTALTTERDRLKSDVARMENITHRLSDGYLDLDLLDEQARSVLGVARTDEIVIH